MSKVTGKDILTEAAKYIGQSYILGALPFRNYPTSKGPWDCAEFTSYVVYKLTEKPYGIINPHELVKSFDAWTNQWKADSERIGKIITIAEAAKTPGAAVLRFTVSGRIGHIAFSDGNGGTIEAHSRNLGVTRAKISGRSWNSGILVPWIDYYCTGSCTIEPPKSKVYRYAVPMMEDGTILRMQLILENQKLYAGPMSCKYGPLTEAAVTKYQDKFGLLVDGQAGPETLAHMRLL